VTRRTLTSQRAIALALAAIVAATAGLATWLAGTWRTVDAKALSARFALRGAQPPPRGVVLVAIDDRTFSDLRLQWPFPRRLHAEVIDRLRRDGARVIAYDVQFTEPTDPRDDDALYAAVARARDVVLATTEVNADGQTDVLGGPAVLHSAHAVAAAANLPADPAGVIRRYPTRILGLPSFASAAAARAGVHATATGATGAPLIDFRGPPGTFTTVSFSQVLRGEVPARRFAGRVVVVGATAATLQDMHLTSTASAEPMSGAEVQANAIWTALHGDPLHQAPGWLTLVTILVGAIAVPLVSLRLRVLASAGAALVGAIAYGVTAQLAFDHAGAVLAIGAPLFSLALGTVGTLIAHYLGAFAERNAYLRQLNASHLELIERLAYAVESRDAETGEHTHRIAVLCRRLARHIGLPEHEADRLMHASIAHDIGKIGIPDSILLKQGPLEPAEREQMQAHTVIGGRLLAGSDNPLVQTAHEIALTHHERWDGTGYPAGLAGEDIPLSGRICAVVDVYDALLSRRRYKAAWGLDDVLAELRRGRGTHFDPRLVDAFLELAPALTVELAPADGAAAGEEPLVAPGAVPAAG
jgi:CHASE2 domain-containing sensor protein